MINYGQQLDDKHVYYAQTIQFSIKGMQLTLYQHTKKPPENWASFQEALFSFPGSVNVYDSLFDDVDCANRKVILDFVWWW